MITDAVIQFTASLINPLFGMMPAVPACNLTGLSAAMVTLGKIIGTIDQFFPFDTVFQCIGLLMIYYLAKQTYQIINFIWIG